MLKIGSREKTRLRRRGLPLFAALLLLLTGPGAGQDQVSLQASVDRATITIGDLITYTVTVIRDENVEVKLPDLGGNLGGFEIRDYEVHQPRREEGRLVDRVDYIISTFETGEFAIPPVEVRVTVPPGDQEQILRTESIRIVVESLKPSEEGDIREIKPPWEIPHDWRPVILFGSVGLALLLAVLAVIFLILRRRRGKALLPRKAGPPRPPHEIAFEKLRLLSQSGLLEKEKIKRYYSEISEIIRRYVEGRFRIIALELTSTDLLEELRSSRECAEEHIELFEVFLSRCDLVKFAKYIPTEEENREAMDLALRIVDRTRVVEEPSPEEEDTEKKDGGEPLSSETQGRGDGPPPLEERDGEPVPTGGETPGDQGEGRG
jgi:hypothetical protein